MPTNGLRELIYLTNTQLDISSTVQMVSIYRATPHNPHMEVVKMIFRYLSGIIDFGFMFTSTRKIKHENFVNAIEIEIRILKYQ
jgi:hypothetical protein